jgi:hypothetical protein
MIPKDKSKQFRLSIKKQFQAASPEKSSLQQLLKKLNPMLRGWSAYYRHASGAERVFSALDYYVWTSIACWLKKKHRGVGINRLMNRDTWRRPGRRSRRWRDDGTILFRMYDQRVERYRHGWMKPSNFVVTSMESPVHSERCTPGSEKGEVRMDNWRKTDDLKHHPCPCRDGYRRGSRTSPRWNWRPAKAERS